jgi:cation transport ATPase
MFPDGMTETTDSSSHEDDVDADAASRKTALLAALKAVEENSSHPIACAIVSFCSAQSCDTAGEGVVDIGDTQEVPGKGMQSTFCSRTGANAATNEILVGNETLMREFGVMLSPRVSALLQTWADQAKSVALVATRPAADDGDGSASLPWSVSAVLAISDPIRHETVPVIEALKSRGIDVWMLSGDNVSTARAVAKRVGIAPDHVLAGVLPSGKVDKVKYLQSTQSARRRSSHSSGRATVAMVGDGVNDSPALAAADVGIAIGSGSDVAISSADFVLIKSDLRAVITLLDLSRSVFQRIKTNFGWAVVYNLVAVPVAAGVLYPVQNGTGNHVRLDPVWAALAMALSSISVVTNSLLLRTGIPVLGFRASRIILGEQVEGVA